MRSGLRARRRARGRIVSVPGELLLDAALARAAQKGSAASPCYCSCFSRLSFLTHECPDADRPIWSRADRLQPKSDKDWVAPPRLGRRAPAAISTAHGRPALAFRDRLVAMEARSVILPWPGSHRPKFAHGRWDRGGADHSASHLLLRRQAHDLHHPRARTTSSRDSTLLVMLKWKRFGFRPVARKRGRYLTCISEECGASRSSGPTGAEA